MDGRSWSSSGPKGAWPPEEMAVFGGGGGAFRWTYAVLAVAAVLFLVAFLTKWFRELPAVRR
ncbi:hypothetical protein ACWD62_06580 [Streptomyces sp. NPDC005146]